MTQIPVYIAEMPLMSKSPFTKTRVLATAFPALNELGMAACGETRLQAAYQQNGNTGRTCSIHLCTEGSFLFSANGTEYIMKTGDFIIIKNDTPWSYRYHGKACRFLWVRCPDPGPLSNVPAIHYGSLVVDGLEAAYGLLYNESLSQQRSALIYHSAAFLLHVVICQIHHQQGRLDKLWQLVDARIEQAWSLDDLAQLAGLARERLRQLCTKEYARSPMQQVAHLRMRRAAQLLEEESMPVQKIAGFVGYENAFAFSRAFKRIMGCSPVYWRSDRDSCTD